MKVKHIELDITYEDEKEFESILKGILSMFIETDPDKYKVRWSQGFNTKEGKDIDNQ